MILDYEKINLEIDEAQHVFSLCLAEAEKVLRERLGDDPDAKALVNSSIAMMHFIASKRHGDRTAEIAQIASSIDGKEFG